MEISEIRERLPLPAVLDHYGLKADKTNRLHCPFHPDKTPSLQLYPATNTYCCFSANCKAGTGDVIEFIRLKERCSKRDALLKATALAGGIIPSITTPGHATSTPESKLFIDTTPLERIAVLTKVFSYFTRALPLSQKAVNYLQGRGIDYKQHDIGYNSGDWHQKRPQAFIKSCEQLGLLKPRPAGGYSLWARDCVLFPLRNKDQKIVSLYGRNIMNDDDHRHFYLAGREGLYPGYPSSATIRLILTESIIDAASFLEQPAITKQYGILALYGTNGLTPEHQQVIRQLPSLQEIILVLNGDAAGEAATQQHAITLQKLLPAITITRVQLPAGEDVNSLLQTHDDATILHDLIESRTPLLATTPMHDDFLFSIENKNPESLPASTTDKKLNSSNTELLLYDDNDLYIEILGGLKLTGLDRMKVTLKVRAKEQLHAPQWHSVDLYHQLQREQLITSISDTLELSATSISQTITQLTTELEQYRLQKIDALRPKDIKRPELTTAQKQQAITELKKPGLLQRTAQLIRESGIVGEETSSLIAYLVYCTRKQPVPLHVMFLGASGSGKTYLQERISELIPAEDKIEITQITENALYYFSRDELKQKLLLIEDLDGAASVFYPLRELQTKRRISKTVTLKDSKGNLKTITLTVEGPVCVSGCTTKEKIYEDNANRCILLYTDMSREQDRRINDYQTKLSAGEINTSREQQYRTLFQHMQRVLKPMRIINPYASYIQLPEQVFKPRRTMTLLLSFIEAVTFYHQYQRDIKKDASGEPFIETTITDIESAFLLLKDVLFSKSDELTRAARSFLENLKSYHQQHQLSSFKVQDIRRMFRMEPRTLQRYMRELSQYGHIKRIGGYKGRQGFEYALTQADEYEQLRTAIDMQLESVLQSIRQQTQLTRQ